MLVVLKELKDSDAGKLMEIYEESNRDNGEKFFPECRNEALRKAKTEQAFTEFIQKEFLTHPENCCCVWEEDGMWLSALRLCGRKEDYFLEALETRPDSRKKGYGELLISAVLEMLRKEGEVTVRSEVGKRNAASLAVHRKCGFEVEQENALDPETGTEDPKVFGMRYSWHS